MKTSVLSVSHYMDDTCVFPQISRVLCKSSKVIIYIYFFFIWVFFQEHSRIARLQGKGQGISLTPNYHFHPLYRHLNIASSWTRTGNLWKSLFCLISSLCYTIKQFPILPQDMSSSLI